LLLCSLLAIIFVRDYNECLKIKRECDANVVLNKTEILDPEPQKPQAI
jgi:hypothetical protein